MIRDAARELPPVRLGRLSGAFKSRRKQPRRPEARMERRKRAHRAVSRRGFPIILCCGLILLLTGLSILLFCVRCCNRQRLSRVAEGTGPLKPQQPGATAKVLIP